METAYLHIVTNHLPVIGVPLALVLLAMGFWRKSDDLKTAAFLIFVFLGLATLVTFLLGQAGEDFVEELAGVSENAIDEHEDFAKFALALVAITASFSLFAILRYQGLSFLRRRITSSERMADGEVSAGQSSPYPVWITLAVLFFAMLSGGVLGYTGKLGGMIRHTEFYGGTQNTGEPGAKKKEAARPEQEPDEADTESGKDSKRNRGAR